MGVGPSAVSVQSVSTAVPPLLLMTVFTNVSCGGLSSLLMTHVTFSPRAIVTVDPVTPLQVHADAVYPGGPVSERLYVPGLTCTFVTAPDPVAPTSGVGPAARNVQAV